MFVNNTNVMIF